MIFRAGRRVRTARVGPPEPLLAEARRRARPLCSGFSVGAVAVDDQGGCHLGFNLEFGTLGLTVHAEQCALVSAFENGPAGIDTVWIDAAPCGHCRQFMLEFGDPVVCFGGRRLPVRTLLPDAFGPEILSGAPSPLARPRTESDDAPLDLESLARRAATESHHPYTGVPSGLAALLEDGTIISARVVESVAFNPTVTPLASLFIQLFQLQADLRNLRMVVLCEADSSVHDADATRSMLRGLAPRCAWRLLRPARA